MTFFSYICLVFLLFYLINYADITAQLRQAVFPLLPRWLGYPLSCALCFTLWFTLAFCYLLIGFGPIILEAPVAMLFVDLLYKRLRGEKSPSV